MTPDRTSLPDDSIQGADLSGYTVLAIDDDNGILLALQRCFRSEPYRFITVMSANEALQFLTQNPDVAVIISDQRMPDMRGTALLANCREIAPHSVRMLLTGYLDAEAAVAAINDACISQYISKPWNDQNLRRIVRTGVTQYHLIRENLRQQTIIDRQQQELQEWNDSLKVRVMQQTTAIRTKSELLGRMKSRDMTRLSRVIDLLTSVVDMIGTRTVLHSQKVSSLAVRVARELGMEAGELEQLRIASLLHDIGEVGIPDRLHLIRAEDMSPDDFEIYSRHPVRGQLLLDMVDELRPASLLVRHHHEHYDGRGFPDGIAGEDIPLGSRIISAADTVDMLLQNAGPADEVTVEDRLLAYAGTRLDPELLPVFIRMLRHTYPAGPEIAAEETVERELPPDQLQPGMILSRDLYSDSGMFMLHRGVMLTRKRIESVTRFYAVDPPTTGVFVVVQR